MSEMRTTFRRPALHRMAVFATVVLSALLGLSLQSVPEVAAQDPGTGSPSASEVPPVPTAKAPPKAGDFLKFDKNRFFLRAVVDFREPINPAEQSDYLDAYSELVAHANQFQQADLEKHAITVPWLTLAKAENIADRDLHRFELIKFEGRLKRILKVPVWGALADRGIDTLYEANIFVEEKERPVTVVFTQLPEGLEPSEEYRAGYPAVCSGYFFRTYAYTTKKEEDPVTHLKDRKSAPLLVAKSLNVRYNPARNNQWDNGYLPLLLICVAVFIALSLGIAWYLWRSDKPAKAVIKQKQGNPFSEQTTEPPVPHDHPLSNPPTGPQSAGGNS